MKKYIKDGKRVVVVIDLGFLNDRRGYSWIGREVRHFRLKKALKKADIVIASSAQAAFDVHKYYRAEVSAVIPETQDGFQG